MLAQLNLLLLGMKPVLLLLGVLLCLLLVLLLMHMEGVACIHLCLLYLVVWFWL
jgi:hypothetical protein